MFCLDNIIQFYKQKLDNKLDYNLQKPKTKINYNCIKIDHFRCPVLTCTLNEDVAIPLLGIK